MVVVKIENARSKLVNTWVDAIVTHSQEKHKNIAQKETLRLIPRGSAGMIILAVITRKKQLGHALTHEHG